MKKKKIQIPKPQKLEPLSDEAPILGFVSEEQKKIMFANADLEQKKRAFQREVENANEAILRDFQEQKFE